MKHARSLAAILLWLPLAGLSADFNPGEVWLDNAGKSIQAHGGGILMHGNTYYWYGIDWSQPNRGPIGCYSSTNLITWKNEGVVFGENDFPPNVGRAFIERPKVIFNPRTGKYVLWMHVEQAQHGNYRYSRAGIAISDSPTGPFKFIKAIRPITEDTGFTEIEAYNKGRGDEADRQKEFGGTFRDMNLFVDDDGAAYVFYASESNWTMYVVRLDDEFTGPATPAVQGKTWARIHVRKAREAPAPFKYNGRYYLITSGCTGWAPNAADYAVAENILGPWTSKVNPCVGTNADKTFDSQSTFVLPVPGRPESFIFMADRWNSKNLPDSRYVWLPLQPKPDGTITIEWRPAWNLSIFDKR